MAKTREEINARRRELRAAKKSTAPAYEIKRVSMECGETISNEAAALLGWKNADDLKVNTNNERGRTSAYIAEMMSREGGCTREEILTGLQQMFPEKELTALKNTVGALMHTLPIRFGWKVNRIQIDPADKRKMKYTIEKAA